MDNINTTGGHNIDDDLNLQNQMALEQGPSTVYICGSCGKDVKVDKDSGIKCLHCGHRIFYKKRDRKLLQYDAR